MIQLLDWQVPRAQQLASILRDRHVAMDASSTGTGKTYVALDVMRQHNATPLVVAPKSVLTTWKTVAKAMGVKLLDVLNMEKLKTGKTKWVTKKGKDFYWNLPSPGYLIIDEVHKASGRKTQNGRMVAMVKVQKLNALLLSATPFDSPLKMRTLGFLFGLHSYNSASFWQFCRQHGCYPALFHGGLDFPKGPSAKKHLEKIHEKIKHLLVRQTVDDIPSFPENHVYPELFDLDADYTAEINAIYAELSEELKSKPDNPLEKQLRARQKTELLKVPLLTDLAEEFLAEGNSVVLFVNFRETVDALKKALASTGTGISTIIGGQSQAVRDSEIAAFQHDITHICIATIQSGGQSISLHATQQESRPRRALITPSFSASEFIQALGRIHRAGATSKAIQRVVLAAGTIEENIYTALQRKIKNIETLVDGDLSGI